MSKAKQQSETAESTLAVAEPTKASAKRFMCSLSGCPHLAHSSAEIEAANEGEAQRKFYEMNGILDTAGSFTCTPI